MNEPQTFLVVDDCENDLLLLRSAFKKAQFNPSLQMVHNGEEAIAYLKGEGPYSDRQKFPLPAVMLLDLNMPRKNGFDVLGWVRTQPMLKRLPIIVFTASMQLEDVDRAFDLGANSFLVKPSSVEELVVMIRRLRHWLELNYFPTLTKSKSEHEKS